MRDELSTQITHWSEQDFHTRFLVDLVSTKTELIILSPFMSRKRAVTYYAPLADLAKRSVEVLIFTKPQGELSGSLREDFAVIERSLNILSHNNTRESMLRLDSPEMARQMLSCFPEIRAELAERREAIIQGILKAFNKDKADEGKREELAWINAEEAGRILDSFYDQIDSAYPLSYLSARSFLPSYAFPSDAARLVAKRETRQPVLRGMEVALQRRLRASGGAIMGVCQRIDCSQVPQAMPWAEFVAQYAKEHPGTRVVLGLAEVPDLADLSADNFLAVKAVMDLLEAGVEIHRLNGEGGMPGPHYEALFKERLAGATEVRIPKAHDRFIEGGASRIMLGRGLEIFYPPDWSPHGEYLGRRTRKCRIVYLSRDKEVTTYA
ncbi:MAG: hypothetical protein KAY24_11740 [Candidatus Eisenbacteria sp.]|nr:hypothetical protein [Candidatus Eisenbacteria bacterium]